jgi:hypothetical protein
MTTYSIVVALHAIAAVLGAGQVLAVLIVAHGHTPDPAVTIIGGCLHRKTVTGMPRHSQSTLYNCYRFCLMRRSHPVA